MSLGEYVVETILQIVELLFTTNLEELRDCDRNYTYH